MRISSAEADKIKTAAERCFGAGTIVRLFGSRADDTRRGGDIDLQIIAADESAVSLEGELKFRAALEDEIGEQKVDVLLRRLTDPELPIDVIARHKGVLL